MLKRGRIKMKRKLSIADYITSARILGTICLIFTELFSAAFYVIYTICGITDVLDGFVARLTNTSSDFGAKLDSVADIGFYTVVTLKWIPYLWEKLPRAVWCTAAIALIIRIACYLVVLLKFKMFASMHTYLNKFNGFVFFLLPYLIMKLDLVVVCAVICVIAVIASFEEFCIHISSREYQPNIKTVFNKIRPGRIENA